MKIVKRVVDDERRVVLTLDETKQLHDTLYVSDVIHVRNVTVNAHRRDDNYWELRDIEVQGDIIRGTRRYEGTARRHFSSRAGFIYSLSDAPDWLTDLAIDGLGA